MPTRAASLRARIGALLIAAASAVLPVDAAQDPLADARALALAGRRAEAIELLQDLVSAAPANADARVLLGTVLSWDARYDEARRELDLVLADSPSHGDALPALINVELWSNHPARADALAAGALRTRPNDAGMLLARARALSALARQREARDVLERLLAIDPRNDPARQLLRDLQGRLRQWHVRAGLAYDAFSDNRVSWRESQAAIGRTTPMGAVAVRGSRASRYGATDAEVEAEMYPRLRPGTYAHVAAAFSPDAVLYPSYRFAADLYQHLGRGFEGSAGFRSLGFGNGITLYAGSLAKHHGNWVVTGRLLAAPDAGGASRSIQGSVRRYVGGISYVGLRYGRGAWRDELRTRNDLEVLDSSVAAAEVLLMLGGRLELSVTGGYSREDRAEAVDLRQYSVATALGFRF